MKEQPIAIVGAGGIFPGAPDLPAFWNNISGGVCAAKEVPAGRWVLPADEAFDPQKGAADKVYSLKGCFVENFKLDPAGLDLRETFLERLDPVFHLALHAARQAFHDAGPKKLDRARTGVIIGNIVLPTDAVSSLALETLLPDFEKAVFGKKFTAPGPKTDPLNRYPAGLPGSVLARALGLSGGSFTLDAACASSLYAVKLAVDALRSGRADAMLTGGVSRPASLYTQMGFSQLRALSASGRPSPFDAAADGLVVGEGAGMFVLKRLGDAVRAGDKIYGVITGIGLSNDIGGSLLAPNTAGQLYAMRAAYRQAALSPSQVDYIECHATGTPTGDPVEVESLKTLWGERGWSEGQCALGSVKSNIGHLLTAAGSAGLMKVLLAFQNKTLPPTANFTRPGPKVKLAGSPFRVPAEAADWAQRDGKTPRRAAVSAFGFGGINAHVLVEDYSTSFVPAVKAAAPAAPAPVAIVGMDARFGPLDGLRQFQEAVLGSPSARPQDLPQERLRGLPPVKKGFYLKEVGAAADAYRIPPRELEEMLPQQLLMLDTAAKAVADSGGELKNAGVFIGLGLDLNTTNFHFRWALAGAAAGYAAEQGLTLSGSEQKEFLSDLREKAGPALSANRTMGALGGIVASRIAREFHVGGPSFTISSGETSGLRALETAVRALRAGELDTALVGAVSVDGDPRALNAADALRPFSAGAKPFDAAAAGTVQGEGAAALVLKRLEDAVRDGDRVYAVIKGLGFASGGGVDAPAPAPQAYSAALREAYAEAQVDPSTVSYLETHGSGIPEEDAAEAEALTDFYGISAAPLPCALGSVKPVIGHTGPACGLAGVVKTALALYQEILPPAEKISPLTALARAKKRFHLPPEPQYWLRNRAEGPRRAGVSALGFDGNCGHVVLEALEHQDGERQLLERRSPLGSRSEALFAIEDDDARGLGAGLQDLGAWLARQRQDDNIEKLARAWFARTGARPGKKRACALLARSAAELSTLCAEASAALQKDPERPLFRDRIYYSPAGLATPSNLAFVFPGSGNQYLGMGRGLWTQWPEIIRRLDAENGYLRGQMVPELFAPWRLTWEEGWKEQAELRIVDDFKSMIFGSVAHGTAVSDLVRSLGVQPAAVIGYSLGETAGLFATRTWTARDEMLRRINESSLFVSDLAGPCDAARRFWNLPKDEKADWVLGVIDRPAETVRLALKGAERAALLIVNAPLECVVGGYRKAVDSLVEGMGCVFLPLQGVSTVHFAAAKLVEKQYRDLHLFPTKAPPGIRFYSGAWKKAYEVTRESAADSIVGQAVHSLDFQSLVKRAYEDGARVFVELGPQASCTRMIDKILGPLPHAARSACVKGQSETGTVLRLLARLLAERAPVDLAALYGAESRAVGHQDVPADEAKVTAQLSVPPPSALTWRPGRPLTAVAPASVITAAPAAAAGPRALPAVTPPVLPLPAVNSQIAPASKAPAYLQNFAAANEAKARAHEIFLRLSSNFNALQSRNIAFQGSLVSALGGQGAVLPPPSVAAALPPAAAPAPAPAEISGSTAPQKVFMNREQCMEFAVGSIAKVLGAKFAAADTYPTRVRLPDNPLMLVDRILSVKGEPGSMTSGNVVTEHDIHQDAWYLDCGRIPTCIAVEAGQADLFLSGYLGIDDRTKGKAMYRLLDAEVTFHRGLPTPGQTIHYDINIERFAQNGDIWLFFFNYESTVDGVPLLSMKKGCAGFFTQEELSKGKGVVLTAEEQAPAPGKAPEGWAPPAPFSGEKESYNDAQLDALRHGDYAGCFGPAFAGLPLSKPVGLPSGKMRLVDRILELSPRGGRYGLGLVQGEMDIHPDDWHLVCHFSDDHVMPGTLMYECCLHTFRVLLLRLGWTAEAGSTWYEPVPGVTSRLECRGQVLPSTKKAMYEIIVKEIGYQADGTPYAIADAFMYADGKRIIHIHNMSIRMSGAKKDAIEALWSASAAPADFGPRAALFDNASITAFAVGKPSEAFGDRYKIFDEGRIIARLPGDPYKFLDRVVKIDNCRQWELKAGGYIEAEYDVPPGEWYFKSGAQKSMPFAVLLEVALQPCGWLAAYLGSALTSDTDLSFRNLGGTAVQYTEVFPDAGILVTKVKITKVSQSGGMIIQDYDMEVLCGGRTVYKGVTQFGFFSKKSLSEQLGVRGAARYAPTPAELAHAEPLELAKTPSLPDEKLIMLDSVETYLPAGGPKQLGFARGLKAVDPAEWFFKAHFYQDPVCPGSLGLESFINLVKAAALKRWPGLPQEARFEAMALGAKHTWIYRGQIAPRNKLVTVEAYITSVDDSTKTIKADGFLIVDNLVIYQMKDFAVKVV